MGAGREQAGLITNPPHEVPFLRAFFEKAVAVLAAQGQGNIRIPVPAQAPLEGEAEPSAPVEEQPTGEVPAAPEEPPAAPAADATPTDSSG